MTGDARLERRGDAETRGHGDQEQITASLRPCLTASLKSASLISLSSRFHSPRLRVSASPRLSNPRLANCLACCLILLGVAPVSLLSAEPVGDNSSAQTARLHQWGAVTLFHGLPSDRVRAIAQDGDGVMWFGTDAGLARYDGRRTQTIAAAGLPPGRVLALKFDADGVLWVGTEAGAARLIGGEFRAVKETEGKAVTAIITPEHGRAILATEQGMIFDCTTTSGGSLSVGTFPGQQLFSADRDHPGPLQITSLALKDDVLYVGTRSRGLLAIERNTVREVQGHARPYFVEAVEIDARGSVWLGAKAGAGDSGLYEARDPLRLAKVGANTGTVTVLRAGARDDLWVGTDGQGAFRYSNSRLLERFTFEGTAGGLRSDHIYSVFVDREDVVWFGTDKGVCRYDPHALRVETISDNPESNFVRTLFETVDGRLFSGTNSGLFVYDDAMSRWQPVQDLAHKTVYAIAEEDGGQLLVGSASGLYESTRPAHGTAGALRFKHVKAEDNEDAAPEDDQPLAGNSVRAISRFQGATYVATYGRGVERLDSGRRTLIWPTAGADARAGEIVSLHADESGRLWIGTAAAGLFFFDGRQVATDPSLAKLNGNAVWAIDRNGDGSLWLATDHGLYGYRSGELTEILPNFDARGVVATGDSPSSRQAWCATAGGGLFRVLLDEQFGALIARTDAEQGLPSQRVFALLPRRRGAGDEALLIGTSRGIARYEPGRTPASLTPTRIISRRIHQPDELRTGLQLEYPQNTLALDVAASSSRTFPEQFQYAFLLYDSSGKVIRQKLSHDAQFLMEGLRPGSYRVVARAFTADLIPSNPLAFEFRVAGAPFPWTTAALSVLLAMALLALWWGYLQNRKLARTGAELMNANRQLAEARMQLANETEAERRRIARDLHDQTLADLRHLLMLTDQLPTNGSSEGQAALVPATFRAEIESISHEVRRICEDLSPSVLENVGLAAALEWSLANAVAHAPPERKFEYEFLCDEAVKESLQLAPNVQMQIYRIAQEAVNNICRHAAATHVRLTVSISEEGDFVLRLEDNGRDFEPLDKKKKRGRGLANIRARASLIEAEVTWSKRSGSGTLFILRQPNATTMLSTFTKTAL